MRLLLSLLQAMSVFFVLFHLYSRSPAFRPQRTDWLRPRARLSLYLFFSGISILGTYLGLRLEGGAVANTRAMGAVLAGLLGGPALGGAVGVTAGLHRISLGGITAMSGAISTSLEGLIAGLVHLYFTRRGTPERIISWRLAGALTALGEVGHMGMLLLVSRPTADVIALIRIIAGPMILANAAGAALFMTVLRDRANLYDKVGAMTSAKALRVAERTLEPLAKGFNREVAVELATIIQEETGVGAVAITDGDTILSFVGAGFDHHRPGAPIASPLTRRAIEGREVVFADGRRERYRCPLSPTCPIASALVVPLEVDGQIIGTVQLFEPRAKRFRSMNRSLGEGLAHLLSEQLLRARYESQKNLLVRAELKLVQAQVNPHFLFNALNTIIAATRTAPEQARALLVHLSNFFRKNLKRSAELSTLEEELDHVRSYLEIERARFPDRLVVEIDVDPELLAVELPTFTLQPLIENAVKHGLAATLDRGVARIRARREGDVALIDVEDNAGTWRAPLAGDGLGMTLVDRRIKSLMGGAFGVSVSCVPAELTRVTVRVPLEARAA
ncbi:sensor histidine kinase [Anaeromyxobacter sp. Fw109-5]|uniref:sensor histidine kinase n=1 Tax=Anaeromyxobacter sp. (strain Fw109-5) TaxID=404589 RepID=UPI0000ED7D16|nr:sensor histidine kinase [Anaeromyxobacter sp. Fw109-5]ABS25648.1 signal transduction histidine kinase, LytS [Anaeromyxobacter sp. Fw109-5]